MSSTATSRTPSRINTRPIRMTDEEKRRIDELREKEMPTVSFNAWAVAKLSTPMNITKEF